MSIAKQDLPHKCPICNLRIKKGEPYNYSESKKFKLGYAYLHYRCTK